MHFFGNFSSGRQDGLIDPIKFDLVRYKKHPMDHWGRKYRRGLMYIMEGDIPQTADSESIGANAETSDKKRKNVSIEQSHVHHTMDTEKRGLQIEKDNFSPLRIRYFTRSLDNTRASQKKIDLVKEILSEASDFWSSALSVVPVDGLLRLDRTELNGGKYCLDPEFSEVPESHMYTGVAATDLILYVSASSNERFCPRGTLALAASCNHDAYDRPVAGAINVCLDAIKMNQDGSFHPAIVQDNKDVMIHEIGHVLGFTSHHLKYFRNRDGSPRTPRPFRMDTVRCVTGLWKTVRIPSKDTLDFFEDIRGNRYATVVTEKVRTTARNHFNCQSLPGGRLENQPTSDSCFGDHWDEKFAYSSTMSAVTSPTEMFITPMTLALFEDSGWYIANYSMSSISPWGHGAGCEFIDEPCLAVGEDGRASVPNYGKGLFCSEESQRGCSPAHTHKMACTAEEEDWEEWLGFNERPKAVGLDKTWGTLKQADYCPVYGKKFDWLEFRDLDCRNAENEFKDVNIYGEYWGESSMCFETSTLDLDWEEYPGYVHSGTGRCYKAYCVVEERLLKVQLNGVWMTCERDFQELTITSGPGGRLTCPRLNQVCPDLFCPMNCAGRGTCEFDDAIGGSGGGKCKCFDKDDTRSSCSSSALRPSGKYIPNSSFLFDEEVEETWFDDLWSIFKDGSETWSGQSWGWAFLLTAVFLVTVSYCFGCLVPRRKRRRLHRCCFGRFIVG